MGVSYLSQIKGILFDKDGTLIDFYTVYVQAVKQLVDQLLADYGLSENSLLKEELLRGIGLQGDQVDPKGIMASGTSEDFAEAFSELLGNNHVDSRKLENLHSWISRELFLLTRSNIDQMKQTADLPELLSQLQRYGIKVGIATADDWEATNLSLEKLGIAKYFGFIGTSDYYDKKPDPCMFHAFCQKYDLKPAEVAVVGDTIVDLHFARNASAGLVIGVLSGVSGPKELEVLADIILPTVGEIVQEDGRLVWESTKTN